MVGGGAGTGGVRREAIGEGAGEMAGNKGLLNGGVRMGVGIMAIWECAEDAESAGECWGCDRDTS